ncbi:hypothetical protein JW968_07530 [Candidatus Woesearchaeota archaeon]|nr:hypothetical protein [Candidatus Woesearchaeota archaeon]
MASPSDKEIDDKIDAFFDEIGPSIKSDSTMIDFFQEGNAIEVYVYGREHKKMIRSMYSAHTSKMFSYMVSQDLAHVISIIEKNNTGIIRKSRLPVVEYHKKAPFYHLAVHPDSWSSFRRYLLRIN